MTRRVKFFAATFFVIFLSAQTITAKIVITEIHRDPAAGNKSAVPGGVSHSFVELANLGQSNFYLQNIFMTNGKTVDTIMPVSDVIAGHEDCTYGQNFIPPGGVAIILSQSYREGVAIDPSSIHPIAPNTIMLAVNRRNIGGGLANDDGVAIYRGTRSQIDSIIDIAADADVFLSAPLQGKIVLSTRQIKGVSIVPANILLGDENENRRYAISSGTHLSPGSFDRLTNGVYFEYSLYMQNDGNVACSVGVIFVTHETYGASWRFHYRESQNQSSSTSTQIAQGNFSNAPQHIFYFEILPQEFIYTFDVDLTNVNPNDIISFNIDLSSFWASLGTLLITEIYPKGGTAAAAGVPDWFELRNVSAADVNLAGFTFQTSRDNAVIIESDFFIPQGGYVVITRDDAAMRHRYRNIGAMIRPPRWITLNSLNDTLTVRSPHGVVVDRAVWRNAWFTRWTSQSLERVQNGAAGVDSTAWVLCDRPTPGHPGGAADWRAANDPSIEIGPVPFRPNGDGVDDQLSIRINLPANYNARVKIFGHNGRVLRTFDTPAAVILWDGRMDNGRPAPVGPVYVVGEFSQGNTRRLIRKNGVLWR